jgi:hypothetical protein
MVDVDYDHRETADHWMMPLMLPLDGLDDHAASD